jgi:hypothetical protein
LDSPELLPPYPHPLPHDATTTAAPTFEYVPAE